MLSLRYSPHAAVARSSPLQMQRLAALPRTNGGIASSLTGNGLVAGKSGILCSNDASSSPSSSLSSPIRVIFNRCKCIDRCPPDAPCGPRTNSPNTRRQIRIGARAHAIHASPQLTHPLLHPAPIPQIRLIVNREAGIHYYVKRRRRSLKNINNPRDDRR